MNRNSVLVEIVLLYQLCAINKLKINAVTLLSLQKKFGSFENRCNHSRSDYIYITDYAEDLKT